MRYDFGSHVAELAPSDELSEGTEYHLEVRENITDIRLMKLSEDTRDSRKRFERQ